MAPDWILAEHGGAMEYDRADFELRLQWAQAAVEAADALSPSGDHEIDWDPHRVSFDPIRISAKPGERVEAEFVVANPTDRVQRIGLEIDDTQPIKLIEPTDFLIFPWENRRHHVTLLIDSGLSPGRHVIPFAVTLDRPRDPFAVTRDHQPDPADVFIILDVTLQ